ncbi:MAG: glycosyltransferase family 9 protein [Verrucomicrobiota bacterium]|nr:glycosyltransferase family 9 protein [Verrucomicrobiota bacterium]
MNRPQGKILIIRGGAIGDFILTLPAIQAVRDRFPQTQLEILGYPRIANLALHAGLVDVVRSIETRAAAGFFARNGTLDPELSDYFSQFGFIFSYLYDPDEIFQTNVAKVSKAQFVPGPHRPSEIGTQHAVSAFLQPMERLAIFDAEESIKINLKTDELLPGTWIALHPGSGSISKNWPLPEWQKLVEAIAWQTDWKMLLVGGEADAERFKSISKLVPQERTREAFNKPLWEMGALLAQCQAFIGHDSGITHLAAALGLRGIVIWGPSNKTVWHPKTPSLEILDAGPALKNLQATEVFEKLRALVIT